MAAHAAVQQRQEPDEGRQRFLLVVRRVGGIAAVVGMLVISGCGRTDLPAPGSSCAGPPAGGVGLLAGTVVLGPDGKVQGVSPRPVPFFTPAPGDADVPVAPGTVVAVDTGASPVSSNIGVLTPVAGGTIVSGQRRAAFRAASSGCAQLEWPGVSVSVAVRAPVS